MSPHLLLLLTLSIAPAIQTPTPGSPPSTAIEIAPHTFLIPGVFPPDRGPDPNTYILQAATGLIVIDTGRHQAHVDRIEGLAHARHLPITALINTHWHLDHVSGNLPLRRDFPGAHVYASSAIDGALAGFLANQAEKSRAALASGKLDAVTNDELHHGLDTLSHGNGLRPDIVIDHSSRMQIDGRPLEIHLAKDAATAGDLWIVDPATRVAFVGDLVTFPAAFLDTACSAGWIAALEEIGQATFVTVAPGHGPLLSRSQFETYRTALKDLLACSASSQPAPACADAWTSAVSTIGQFTEDDRKRARSMTTYYITDVLRPQGGNSAFCAAHPHT